VNKRGASTAVAVRVEAGIGWVTLARPASRNGLDLPVAQGLVSACEDVALDPAVHVVVLRAGGRDFCVGVEAGGAWLDPAWPDPVAAVAALPQPVIAAVDGEAAGWGFALALACDLRLATTRAVFSAPDVLAGRAPGGGLTQRLPRIVGVGRATSLLMLGTRLRARDALAWGLVTEVVPPERLAHVVTARAQALAARGPIALRYAKEAVGRAFDLPLEDGVRLEHDLYVLLQTTADRREGIEAFRARRRPRFRAQ
jgi:enoyl-CoA hydratase/carnithine racemase